MHQRLHKVRVQHYISQQLANELLLTHNRDTTICVPIKLRAMGVDPDNL